METILSIAGKPGLYKLVSRGTAILSSRLSTRHTSVFLPLPPIV